MEPLTGGEAPTPPWPFKTGCRGEPPLAFGFDVLIDMATAMIQHSYAERSV
jgi:hypothetical protein